MTNSTRSTGHISPAADTSAL